MCGVGMRQHVRLRLAHNVLQSVLYGEFQANAVAPCELQWRPLALWVIDWPNGVDNMISVSVKNVSSFCHIWALDSGCELTLGDCSLL